MRIRSVNTVEIVHAVISGVFSEAIDLGYTEHNPAYGLLKRILPPKKKKNINEPDPSSRQDLDRFLEAAWSKLPEPFPLILETMAMSGMRLGESLAMSWGNLDATLVAKLDSHIKKLKKASLAAGVIPRYLFPGITQRLVQGAVRRACLAAKLRTRSPHDLPHTYVTLLLMDHYSPAYVQKQLGHHSISMTVDIYRHWVPGEGKKDLTQTLHGPKANPGQTLTVVGDNRPQRPQQVIPGVAAHSFCPVGDEVGDKSC